MCLAKLQSVALRKGALLECISYSSSLLAHQAVCFQTRQSTLPPASSNRQGGWRVMAALGWMCWGQRTQRGLKTTVKTIGDAGNTQVFWGIGIDKNLWELGHTVVQERNHSCSYCSENNLQLNRQQKTTAPRENSLLLQTGIQILRSEGGQGLQQRPSTKK